MDNDEEADKPLPPLRSDLDFYPGARTAEGAPTWVIYDSARHRYFSIGRLEFQLLRYWENQSPVGLALKIEQAAGVHASPAQIDNLKTFLEKQQLLRRDTPEDIGYLLKQEQMLRPAASSWLLHRYLFFRIPLWHPDRFLNATLPLVRFLFTPSFMAMIAVCALAGFYLVSRQWETFLSTFPYFFSLPGMVTFAVTLFFAKIIHELGHAYTAKYYGLNVPTIGLALIVMWPVLYTDTSDAWKLTSRYQRLRIDAAGIAAELTLAVFATLLWSFFPDGPVRSALFMVAAVTWMMTLLVNLNPCMRFDGYYLLGDLLGVSNLQDRSFALGRWRLREGLFALGDPPPERLPVKRRRTLIIYAYSTWIYRLFLFIGIALLVYYFFFKLAGIALMFIELAWFIGRPVYKEVAYWFSRRKDMCWNRHTVLSLFLLSALLALLVVPWQTTVEAPAIYRTQNRHNIYAPAPARIHAIHIRPGQTVAADELLFVLEDPDIDHNLESAQRKETLLRLQLDLQAADRVYLERSHVLQNQLAETQAKIQSYQAQKARLQIRAPFAGKIADMADALRTGRWINPELLLALLADRDSSEITAFVEENDLPAITVGETGRFYPDTPDAPVIDATITDVYSANISQLQAGDHYVASVHEGELPVRETSPRLLIPHEATYRIRLLVQADVDTPDRVYRGTVVLQTPYRRSLLQRAWTLVWAVFIRESGF
ncbi:MAG: HlyD family efflux transporter periplasmic adaptor subunit [Gammaproteobacteria bacterium]|nr:HlyD family efflux transporter periplasmic adaptor subunit [Gammaproteobacteria bacterium]